MKRQPSLSLRLALSRADSQRAGRQPGQVRFVFDHELEAIGGIENILGIFRGELGQLDIQLFQALLAGGVELGAMAAEGVHGFHQEAAARAGEMRTFGRRGEFLQSASKGLHGAESPNRRR